MIVRWLGSLFATLLLIGAPPAIAGPLTLGSGKTVEILEMGPLYLASGASALMLKYRTEIPLADLPTLRKEVDEIWQRFVVDAEHGGYQSAVISANEPPTGFIVTHNSGYNFVFEKKDGSWRTHETRERAQAKLDPDFMREFMDRIDWAYDHHELNASLLYMADDWTVTGNTADPNGPGPQTMDRAKFMDFTNAMFAHMTAHRHHREITRVAISDGGAAARVESRESETTTVNGHELSTTGPTIDTFELRGDIVLWTKSTTLIEKQTDTRSD